MHEWPAPCQTVGTPALSSVVIVSVMPLIEINRVQQASAFSGVPITYCAANIRDRKAISLHAAYNICAGEGKAKGDGVLCLLPGTPLMVKVSHRKSPFTCFFLS